jgi:hypothetical protein
MTETDVQRTFFGLTGPTGASGVSAQTMEALKAHVPTELVLQFLGFEERWRPASPEALRHLSWAVGQPRTFRFRAPLRDELLDRIETRRNRLLGERGRFSDSVEILRELRDAEA